MALSVTGSPRGTPLIEVSALFGKFRVPGSSFTVRFASTFANATTDGHRELLAQLKPMRDRVDAAALTDLSALLQRDLNDRRVAQELIPYLLGNGHDMSRRIGFFPAVLAVLIPRGYLEQGAAVTSGVAYPVPDGSPERDTVTYQASGAQTYAWKVERYAADGVVQPVGLLKVNPRESEIVVLDGQHRSNAFRFIAGDFDPSNDIYGTFYDGIVRPPELEADLPVTVIWFESDDATMVQPSAISRQLFVDVNNSAHAVSLARTILLDDRSVSALTTQAFYNRAAQQGFGAGSFSLLHAAFDMDSDLAGAALPAFALTTPEIAEAAFYWLLLGSGRFSGLSTWRVDRLRAQRNRTQFNQVVGTAHDIRFGTDEDEGSVIVRSSENAETFRQLALSRVVPVLWKLMNGISVVQAHYDAAVVIKRWVEEEADTTVVLAWRKIFIGGEGLYWTFADRSATQERNIYAIASQQIEQRFRNERAAALQCTPQDADAVFKSFATKAFQVGFVMAAALLAERGRGTGNVIEAAEDLLAGLNAYDPRHWIALFRDVRPLIFRGDATPKLWPSYRNLLVRMFDQNQTDVVGRPEELPELYAFDAAIEREAKNLAEDQAEMPAQDDMLRRVRAQRDRISEIFDRAGMRSEWFRSDDALTHGRNRFQRAFAE